MISNRFLCIGLAAALVGYAQPALAYLDPGTGSMIMSAIVGLIATVVLAVKTYWYRLKRFITGSPRSQDPEPSQPDADGEPTDRRETG